MAPASAASHRLKRPSCTRNPAYGMMSSEGSGMHADSIPIRSATPGYPNVEITVTTKWCSAASMLSTISFYEMRKRKGLLTAVLRGLVGSNSIGDINFATAADRLAAIVLYRLTV